jgi:hypothetical protein
VSICVPPKTKEQDIMLRQLKYIIKHKGGGGKEWKIRPNRSKKLCIKLERIFFLVAAALFFSCFFSHCTG